MKRPAKDNCRDSEWRYREEDNCGYDRKDWQRITAWCGDAMCVF